MYKKLENCLNVAEKVGEAKVNLVVGILYYYISVRRITIEWTKIMTAG